MPTPTKEKIYFEEYNVKVTNLRFCFHNDTIPIDQITATYVHHRVLRLTLTVFGFIGSFFTLIYGHIGLLIITSFFIWLFYEYTHYVSLYITVKDKNLKVKNGSIAGCRFIYNIEDALMLAMEESQKLMETGDFEYTDSMKFSLKMKELES